MMSFPSKTDKTDNLKDFKLSKEIFHGREGISLLTKNVLRLINKMFIPQIQILLLIPQQQKRTALHEAKYWLPCYVL